MMREQSAGSTSSRANVRFSTALALPCAMICLMGSSGTCSFSISGSGEFTVADGGTDGGGGGGGPSGGEVAYSGEAYGRVYINVSPGSMDEQYDDGVAATSIDSPGSYQLDLGNVSLTDGQAYTVTAWMDTLDEGGYLAPADPVGSVTATVAGGALSVPTITLTDPESSTPAMTSLLHILPFNGGAVAFFSPITDMSGNVTPTGYDVVATPAGGGSGTPVSVRAESASVAIFSGLADGGSYDFQINGVDNGTSWTQTSYEYDPVTLSAPAMTGGSITGTVDVSSITFPMSNPSPIVLVLASDTSGSMYYLGEAAVDEMTSVPFGIYGLSNSSYQLTLAIDIDGNGELGPTDVLQQVPSPVTVIDGTSSPQSLTVAGGDVLLTAATLRTVTYMDSGSTLDATYTDDWATQLLLVTNRSLAVQAAVESGQGFLGAQDMAFPTRIGTQWSAISNGVSPVDDPGMSPLTFSVDYQDDTSTWPFTTWPTSSTHTKSITETPTILPVVTGVTVTCDMGPLISWSAPSGMISGGYSYSVTVMADTGSEEGGPMWQTSVPSGTTTATYAGPTLTSGTEYTTGVSVVDDSGNTSEVLWNFICGE